jgi:hypothetical protein
MSRNIVIHPNRGTTGSTAQPYISFDGLSAATINLVVEDDGSITFDGDTGSLFGISDSKDGLLSSVNDVSGLPILAVYDNDYIYMGKWDEPTLIVSGQSWNIIGGSGHTVNSGVTNSAIIGGAGITATTSNTTYVPNLNILTINTGTSVNNLGIDVNGNVIVGSSGGTSYWTLENGSLKDTEGGHTITNSTISSLIGGGAGADINSADYAIILGGSGNTITGNGDYSGILGGIGNSVTQESKYSVLLGGGVNTVGGAAIASSVLGGTLNDNDGDYSSIVAGSANTINNGVLRTVILGGNNITATQNDSVYVPDLYLTNLPSESVLGTDANGKIIAGTGGGMVKS